MFKKNYTPWNKRHGKTHTSEYKAWCGLKSRCYNKKDRSYHNYGGRGIKVCERWLQSFDNFFEDMGVKPDDSYSIERKDNNGDYYNENCIWADKKTQSYNRRRTIKINFEGKLYCLKALAKHLNIPVSFFSRYYSNGKITVTQVVDAYKKSTHGNKLHS